MLTCVFATHNGAKTLPVTLEAFTQLEEPEGGWKLIAVDNASTDKTAEILASYKDRLPLTILNQPQRGKNRALNLAIPYFEGDLIVFTDDDVVPATDWLVQMRLLADTQPKYSIFGGKILPLWPFQPPNWLLHYVPLNITFALTPDDRQDGPVKPGLVVGPNMAVRNEIFLAGHKYSDEVGPMAGQYIMGSEAEFQHRLAEYGYRAWFSNDIIVQHIIRPHQMEWHWVLKRAFRYGRGNRSLQADRHRQHFRQLFGVPRWIWSQFVLQCYRFVRAFITRDPDAKVQARWQIAYLRGYIYQSWHP